MEKWKQYFTKQLSYHQDINNKISLNDLNKSHANYKVKHKKELLAINKNPLRLQY